MRSRTLALIALGAPAALLLAAGSVLAALSQVTGYAYVASVDVTPPSAARIVDGTPGAGPLEATGGSDSNGGLSTCIPAGSCEILSTGDRGAFTGGEAGDGGFVSSGASARNFSAFGGLVTGTYAGSSCAVDAAGALTGSTTLENVQINGVPADAQPAPNASTVLLDSSGEPAGRVVLNEQVTSSGADSITVNAIHIALDVPGGSLGTGDVLISHVECGGTVAATEPADTAAPTTGRPLVRLVPGSSLGPWLLGRVTWTASDTGGSGIDRFRIQQRVDGGPWATINSTVKTPSLDRYFRPGRTTYQLRVQAWDNAGNASSWVEGPTFRFPIHQETSTAIAYEGSWRQIGHPTSSGGAMKQSRTTGSEAAITFQARTFALVAPTGPRYGWARVYIDGRLEATVSLHASSRQPRTVVYTTGWSAWGTHTAEVVVVGARGHRGVALDAIVTGG